MKERFGLFTQDDLVNTYKMFAAKDRRESTARQSDSVLDYIHVLLIIIGIFTLREHVANCRPN